LLSVPRAGPERGWEPWGDYPVYEDVFPLLRMIAVGKTAKSAVIFVDKKVGKEKNM
jgi:hypothetical protein